MPLVNRLLDAFFRTLDAVDVARERLDRALGRSPRPEPWATEWSPVPEAPPASGSTGSAPSPSPASARASQQPSPSQPAQQQARPKKKAATTSSVRTQKTAGAKKKGSGGNRKGSVDRSGKDVDSPRAKAIHEQLRQMGFPVITEDAALDGKRVLARVLWALYAADKAGSELGVTAADASALLSLAGGMEVFATNVARTCRDEKALIEESEPDGRSKRYRLTDQGRAAASKIATRPLLS